MISRIHLSLVCVKCGRLQRTRNITLHRIPPYNVNAVTHCRRKKNRHQDFGMIKKILFFSSLNGK